MVYILCTQYWTGYVDILGVYLNKDIAYEEMVNYNRRNMMVQCTIKIMPVIKSIDPEPIDEDDE